VTGVTCCGSLHLFGPHVYSTWFSIYYQFMSEQRLCNLSNSRNDVQPAPLVRQHNNLSTDCSNIFFSDEITPKFLVFFNSHAEAQSGANFLHLCLPTKLCDKVKWFHSGILDEFRKTEMQTLLVGEVYGHAATDAASMVGMSFYLICSLFSILLASQGIDIPDVTLVVQYQVLRELSTWNQRAGWVDHNPDLRATAVITAEPSFCDEEREAAAQRAADQNAKKHQAVGQLQLSSLKCPGSSTNSAQSRAEVTEKSNPGSSEELRCKKAMDDFTNQ
jgi:superfamily II DNA/RNA helicase